MIAISDKTRRRIEALFPATQWEKVSEFLLHECGDNLPMVEASYEDLAERVRFAVLKLSDGNFQNLAEQTREAAKDWRDVLMAAGFAEDIKSHLAWEPDTDVDS